MRWRVFGKSPFIGYGDWTHKYPAQWAPVCKELDPLGLDEGAQYLGLVHPTGGRHNATTPFVTYGRGSKLTATFTCTGTIWTPDCSAQEALPPFPPLPPPPPPPSVPPSVPPPAAPSPQTPLPTPRPSSPPPPPPPSVDPYSFHIGYGNGGDWHWGIVGTDQMAWWGTEYMSAEFGMVLLQSHSYGNKWPLQQSLVDAQFGKGHTAMPMADGIMGLYPGWARNADRLKCLNQELDCPAPYDAVSQMVTHRAISTWQVTMCFRPDNTSRLYYGARSESGPNEQSFKVSLAMYERFKFIGFYWSFAFAANGDAQSAPSATFSLNGEHAFSLGRYPNLFLFVDTGTMINEFAPDIIKALLEVAYPLLVSKYEWNVYFQAFNITSAETWLAYKRNTGEGPFVALGWVEGTLSNFQQASNATFMTSLVESFPDVTLSIAQCDDMTDCPNPTYSNWTIMGKYIYYQVTDCLDVYFSTLKISTSGYDTLGSPSLIGKTVSFKGGAPFFSETAPVMTIVESDNSAGCSTKYGEKEGSMLGTAQSALNSGTWATEVHVGSGVGRRTKRLQLDTGSPYLVLETKDSVNLGDCWATTGVEHDSPVYLNMKTQAECDVWADFKSQNDANWQLLGDPATRWDASRSFNDIAVIWSAGQPEGNFPTVFATSFMQLYKWTAAKLQMSGHGGAELAHCGLYNPFDFRMSPTFQLMPANASLPEPNFHHPVPPVPAFNESYPTCNPQNCDARPASPP